jgi:hypothetical protein
MLRRLESFVFVSKEGLKVMLLGPNSEFLAKLPSSPTGAATKQFALT